MNTTSGVRAGMDIDNTTPLDTKYKVSGSTGGSG